jgi:hypothetical protein
MTVVIMLVSRAAVVAAADRRLTYAGGKVVDTATKVLQFESADAHGVMSYAGVGKVSVEVSTWLENLFIGNYHLPLEMCLAEIMDEAKKTVLADKSYNHSFYFAGFHNRKPVLEVMSMAGGCLQQITLAGKLDLIHDFSGPNMSRVRIEVGKSAQIFLFGSGITAFKGIGSGKLVFDDPRLKGILKDLNLSPRRPESRRRLAIRLATIIRDVSMVETSVGPDAVVAWRDSKKTGEQWLVDSSGAVAVADVPIVASGYPVRDMVKNLLPMMQRHIEEADEAFAKCQPLLKPDNTELKNAVKDLDAKRSRTL